MNLLLPFFFLLSIVFRSLEGIVWLLWQCSLWLYRVVKWCRMAVETADIPYSLSNIEDYEMGPTIWENNGIKLFFDKVRPQFREFKEGLQGLQEISLIILITIMIVGLILVVSLPR
jgi:hypothetical protein